MRLRLAIFLLLAIPCQAQLWSGVLDPARAIDWSTVGVPGGIPSASWTQCGSTIAAGASATTINTAISSCAANHFVLLGAGTFNLNVCLVAKSNVELRGTISGGTDASILHYTSNSCSSCGGIASGICIGGSNNSVGGEQNVGNATGLTQGSTQITITNIGSTTPAVGSSANIAVGTPITLDQLDEVSDTAWIWNCLVTGVCSNGSSGGGARLDGTCNGAMCNRSEQQVVTVTSIVPGCTNTSCTVNISPAIRMSNWSSGQKPQAWWPTTFISNAGVQNVSFDATSGSSGESTILFFNATNSWAIGNRSLVAGRAHVTFESSAHNTVVSNYFFQSQSHASRSYGAEDFSDGDNLIENNIFQQITEPNPNNAGGTGDVFAYNFCINDVYVTPGWFQPCANDHASGNAFNLTEGNIGGGYQADNVHGTHNFLTTFRNRWIGWQPSCNGTPCTAQTDAVQSYASSRFFNYVGNVLGETGYHNAYKVTASSSAVGTNGNTAIFALGFTGNGGNHDGTITGFVGPSCGGTGTNSWDQCTTDSAMFWGNYDTVNATSRFNCSEVPTTLAQFPNPCPASHMLPASFFLSAKPSFWQGEPFPPIGPDVSSGNLGICSGGSMSGSLSTSSSQCPGGSLVADVGGHANSNPAMDCALTIMGMPADGTGSALSFNPNACFSATSPAAATPTFSPVAGTYTTTQSVTISTTSVGAIICWNTTGSPATNGTTGCASGTLYSGAITVASNETIFAVAGGTGFSDSAVGSAAYVIAPVVSTPTFSPVAGTYSSTQSITITSSTTGATICYTTDGTTPTANGAGTCTHGTTYTTPVSVSSSLTLKAIGSKSGNTDSSVGSAVYIISTTPPPAQGVFAII